MATPRSAAVAWQGRLTQQEEAMREPGRMASPFLLSLLLLRGVGAWLHNRAASGTCDETQITVVVALSSSLRAAGMGTIAGCYERNTYSVAQDRPVYTKTAEGTTFGVLGSQVSTGSTVIEPGSRGWRRGCAFAWRGGNLFLFCSPILLPSST